MMWSSHMQRSREWKHLLMQRLPEMEGSAPEKLTDICLTFKRMWEHPHNSVGGGGHQIRTVATWL